MYTMQHTNIHIILLTICIINISKIVMATVLITYVAINNMYKRSVQKYIDI